VKINYKSYNRWIWRIFVFISVNNKENICLDNNIEKNLINFFERHLNHLSWLFIICWWFQQLFLLPDLIQYKNKKYDDNERILISFLFLSNEFPIMI